MTVANEPSDAKRRIVDRLKRVTSSNAVDLADLLGVTPTAVRQHLDGLEANGLIERSAPVSAGGRGRPAQQWSLTPLANDLFPDRHADLTVDLIGAIRDAVGEEGLTAVIAARSDTQRRAYREAVGETPVSLRAARLADIRSAEGYMAEAVANDDGTTTLIEHHCPICDAATTCQGLCVDELETFQELFAGVATVQRTAHVLSGDQRCAYRITPNSRTGRD